MTYPLVGIGLGSIVQAIEALSEARLDRSPWRHLRRCRDDANNSCKSGPIFAA